MPFFPALPQPESAIRSDLYDRNQPINALTRGLSTGLAISKSAMENQKLSNALSQEAKTEEALRQYGETGDINPVLQANPKIGLQMRKEERIEARDAAKNERELLTKAVDYADKVLPYFAVGDPGPERWNAFRQHMDSFGLGHLVGPTWSKENIDRLVELKREAAGKLGLADRMMLQQQRDAAAESRILLKEALRPERRGGRGGGSGGGTADGKTYKERRYNQLRRLYPDWTDEQIMDRMTEESKQPYSVKRDIDVSTKEVKQTGAKTAKKLAEEVEKITRPQEPGSLSKALDSVLGVVGLGNKGPVSAPGGPPRPATGPTPDPKYLRQGQKRKMSDGSYWTLDANGRPARVQ